MKINSINIFHNKPNFKSIMAPQKFGDQLKKDIFCEEVGAYDKVTELKNIDVLLLEYNYRKAFIFDKSKKDETGNNITYKVISTADSGDFEQRVKDAIVWTKADENFSVASELLQDKETVDALGTSMVPLVQAMTKNSDIKEFYSWQRRLEHI